MFSFVFFFFFFKIFSFFLLHAFSTAVFVLFLQVFLAMFVISFGLVSLSFTQFLLLTFSIVPCFFSSCFFILVFTSILLYKRIWAFMDLYQSKGSWTQFSIICQSHSFKDLYSTTNMYSTVDLYFTTYHFPLHFFLSPGISVGFCFFSVFFFLGFSCSLVFLVGLWDLLFIGLLPYEVLGTNLQKRASTNLTTESAWKKTSRPWLNGHFCSYVDEITIITFK